VVKDKKRLFRLMSIEQGEDPAAAGGTQTPPGEAMGGAPQAGGGEGDEEGGANLDGLPAAEGVIEEEDVIVDERAVGRPPEGRTLGTDRHPLGRDPFGAKENEKALHRDTEEIGAPKRKRGLSRESLDLRQFMKGLKEKFPGKGQKVITESSEGGSYLDESVLIEENDE